MFVQVRRKVVKTRKPTNVTDVYVLADSHGRGLSQHIITNSSLKVSSTIKPGAKSNFILNTNLSENKLCVILAGANDVYCNESTSFLKTLHHLLASCPGAHTIICTIPRRHDLPSWSAVNVEIKRVNYKIRNLCKVFKNMMIIDLENLGRRFHSRHGMHLNSLGKRFISDDIIKIARSFKEKMKKEEKGEETIALP